VRPRAIADRHDPADAGGAGAVEHLRAILGKAGVVQVGVGIHQHVQRSRAPLGTSSWNPARTGGSPSPSEAATIMPFDSSPRILRGFRLATTTTLRPISVAGS